MTEKDTFHKHNGSLDSETKTNGNGTKGNDKPLEMVNDSLTKMTSDFGAFFIEESLEKGRVIEIPSLHITIQKKQEE